MSVEQLLEQDQSIEVLLCSQVGPCHNSSGETDPNSKLDEILIHVVIAINVALPSFKRQCLTEHCAVYVCALPGLAYQFSIFSGFYMIILTKTRACWS